MGVNASVDADLPPLAAFDRFVEELARGLEQRGLRLESGPQGRITEGPAEVGRVLSWKRGQEIRLEWRQAGWRPEEVTEVGVVFEPRPPGTRVILEHARFGGVFRDRGEDLLGWYATEVAAPMLQAMAPARLGDWVTDRQARRPSGRQSEDVYRDPLYHRPNFALILHTLALTPDDRLVEVGCGGGAFLHDALRSGCTAAAVDHSPDMVRLATEVNRDAVQEGRLEIREADASQLPFANAAFTCAVSTGVFGFLRDPLAALREIHRVLAPGGRLVLFAVTEALRGTPAAPEPIASRLHFYRDDELESMARKAGFATVRVERPDLGPFAKEIGVPERDLGSFSGRASQLLVARKA